MDARSDRHESATQAAPNVHPLPVQHPSHDPYVWEHVRADYRAGVTYSRLSEKYGFAVSTIVARRKAEGWKRDLRQEVREEVAARLVADSVPLGSPFTDEAAVAAAATVGVEVVRKHRRMLGTSVDTISEALAEVQAQLRLARQAKPVDHKLIGYLSGTLLNLANAQARVVPLERVAFGLNDREEEKPYDERLREWAAARSKAA